MPTQPDLADVERFATVSARVAHPFAVRSDVLREAGLDARGWEEEQARWTKRFLERGGEHLARRFGDVFDATRAGLFAPAPPESKRTATPRFLTAEPQPWRTEAAAVPLGGGVVPAPLAAAAPAMAGLPGAAVQGRGAPNPLAATVEPDTGGTPAALPFARVADRATTAPLPAPSPPAPRLLRGAPNLLAATVDPPAVLPVAALPFAATGSVAASPVPGAPAPAGPLASPPPPPPGPPSSSDPSRKA